MFSVRVYVKLLVVSAVGVLGQKEVQGSTETQIPAENLVSNLLNLQVALGLLCILIGAL